MESEYKNFIFQQDGAPPDWKKTLCAYLNETLSKKWIGHGKDEDSFMMKWLLWSLDLSSVGFLFTEICVGSGLYCALFLLALMNSSRKSFLHLIMLPERFYSMFGKNSTTDLTCAMTQAVNIFRNQSQNKIMMFIT